MKDAQKIAPPTARPLRWLLAAAMVLSGMTMAPAPASAQHGPAYAPTHKPRVWRYRHNVWRGDTQGRRWRSRPRYRRIPRRPMYRPPRPAYRVGPGRVWVPAPPRRYRGRVYVAPPRVYVVPTPHPRHHPQPPLPNGGHVQPPEQRPPSAQQPRGQDDNLAPQRGDYNTPQPQTRPNDADAYPQDPPPQRKGSGVRPPPPAEPPNSGRPSGLPADLDPTLPAPSGASAPALDASSGPAPGIPKTPATKAAPAPIKIAPKTPASAGQVPLPPPDVRGTLADAQTAAIAAEVLRLINVERVKAKLPPLVDHVRLSTAAWLHSREMYTKRYFSHESPTKRSKKFTDRIRNAGVVKHGAAGENIAMTHLSKDVAKRLVQMWMNSPGHRANILHKSFRFSGLGIYGDGDYVYGTQVFTQKVATPAVGSNTKPKPRSTGATAGTII